MVQIDSFDLEQAKAYIDSLVTETSTGNQQKAYEQARDEVLAKLSAAFSPAAANDKNAFLSFIGYPPVLDAIATLLREERNYHRIQQTLSDGIGGQLEIGLLIRISDYLLDRDKEKALTNFIEGIASVAGGFVGQELRKSLYNREEQCARALSRALSRPFPRRVIEDNMLNEQYEKAVGNWYQDHPFLDDAHVRNAVFEAFAVTRCTLSTVREYQDLAHDYTVVNRPTYHLLYILAELVKDDEIDIRSFNMLIQSCSEFLGTNAYVSIDIDGNSWEESDGEQDTGAELTIEIEFPKNDQKRTFVLKGTVGAEVIPLGPYLVNTSVTLPCTVVLSGTPAVTAIGDCSISARSVHIDTPDLILHNSSRQRPEGTQGNAGLFINTRKAEGHAHSVGAGKIEIQCVDHALDYPLAKYVQKVPAPPFVDSTLQEKYRRLRRIFSEFASHKKGRLAKYRAKIEHERVLRNQLGRQILEALINEGVLWKDSKFYYVEPDQCDAKLGISWHQLRQYKSSKNWKHS